MTERQAYNYGIQKMQILARDNYTCQRCGKKGYCLAHRIAQDKVNIMLYGEEIIHHPFNLVTVCDNHNCNDSYNIGNNPGETKKLLEKIRLDNAEIPR